MIEPVKRRKILVLVNPFGGRKIAAKVYRTQVEPMLQHCHIVVDTIATQRPNHAYEIAQTLELGLYDGIVTVSGDGLLHELINGFMAHKDWKNAIHTPVGIIPCGSGNGLAASMNIFSL